MACRTRKTSNSENLPERVQLAGKALFLAIAPLVEQARRRAAAQVNSEMLLLYWQIGSKIKESLMKEGRAEYGKFVVEKLSELLRNQYGRGFSQRNLFHMVRCYEAFPSDKTVQTLSALLSWSHLLEIIYIRDDLKRSFYLEMCRHEGWSVRVLKDRIRSMLYERTAISKKPEKLIERELSELRDKREIGGGLVFRDPYLLDFLELADTYSERDMEACILNRLGQFIVEFGSDFAFLGRQKRITIGDRDYFIDLLFYHCGLRALVA